MIKNGTFKKVIGSKPMVSTYYKKIDRTRDLLKTASVATKKSFTLLASNYYIAPSSVTFDDMVEEAIYELNLLVTKMDPPSSDDILNNSILANSIKYSTNAKNAIQGYLEKEKHTGVLVKVASELNASKLDALSRAILSEEGIFLYLSYRSIVGHEVTDSSGIASKVLSAINIVKSYINMSLVSKVIRKENLSVTDNERTHVERHFADTEIDYYPGEPSEVITDYIDRIKDSGSLYRMVMDFLTSNKVELPRGTDVDVLAEKMVNYLNSIGYVYQANNGGPSNDGGGSATNGQPDDFDTAIKGVGPKNSDKFKEAGIKRFYQLAGFTNESLKERLGEQDSAVDYSNVIRQAQLIAESKFQELIELQNSI